MTKLPHIAIFAPAKHYYLAQARIGARQRQRAGNDLIISIPFYPPSASEMVALLGQQTADGFVIFAPSPEWEQAILDDGRPAVNLSARLTHPRLPQVLPDHGAMGRMAAETLLARGYRRLVFSSSPNMGYAALRSQGFTAAVQAAGCHSVVVEGGAQAAMAAVNDLGLPAGIVAYNDLHASRILDDALARGWNIPHDLAILGLDDDEQICESAAIPLASIAGNGRGVGALAIDTVLALIAGNPPPSTSPVAKALGLVERESLGPGASDDVLASKVLQILSDERQLAIDVGTLGQLVDVPPATLDRHCRKHLGSSPYRLIQRARLARAEVLLRNSDDTLAQIARRCGWKAADRLIVAFRKAHGTTPDVWRQHQRD